MSANARDDELLSEDLVRFRHLRALNGGSRASNGSGAQIQHIAGFLAPDDLLAASCVA